MLRTAAGFQRSAGQTYGIVRRSPSSQLREGLVSTSCRDRAASNHTGRRIVSRGAAAQSCICTWVQQALHAGGRRPVVERALPPIRRAGSASADGSAACEPPQQACSALHSRFRRPSPATFSAAALRGARIPWNDTQRVIRARSVLVAALLPLVELRSHLLPDHNDAIETGRPVFRGEVAHQARRCAADAAKGRCVEESPRDVSFGCKGFE